MPYRTFIAGEEAIDDHYNLYLMGQTVARFPNASTRATAIVSPALNQLTVCDDRGIVQRWTGSAWVDAASGPLSDNQGARTQAPFIQMGTTISTTDAFGSTNITFPTGFATAPIVMALSGDFAQSAGYWTGLVTTGTTGFTVGNKNAAGYVANATLRTNWIAIGVRP